MKLAKHLLLCAALSAAVYWLTGVVLEDLGPMRVPLTLVSTAPAWLRVLAPYLLDILPAIRRKAVRDALEPWNGRYYAFENRQIRLYLIDDIIWVPVRDVAALVLPQPAPRELRILGAGHGTIPGLKLQGYTEAGLLRLLGTRNSGRSAERDLVRFKLWLETDAFPNLRRLPASASPR